MKKIVLIALLSLVAVFVIYKVATYTEPVFKQVKLNTNNNQVYNSTGVNYMDSIVYVGLDQMHIDGVRVVIRPLIKPKSSEDMTFKAHIVATDYNYIIFTGSYPRAEALTVLTHELIHLHQYHTGRLVVKDNKITWQGDTSDMDTWLSVSYSNRPWEQEAFKEQGELRDKVKKVLYQ